MIYKYLFKLIGLKMVQETITLFYIKFCLNVVFIRLKIKVKIGI